MRVLVTGASGFIGTHLLQTLKSRHEVFGLVRELPRETAFGDVQWIEHDLAQPLVRSGLPGRVDAIVHLAQSRSYREFPDRAQDIFDVNIQGTFNLLEYARYATAECFIYASTGGLYGHSDRKFAESDPIAPLHADPDPTNPLSFYFSSKYIGELMVASYQSFFRTVVLRLFFVYGAGQKRMLIPNFLEKVRKGEPIVVEGNPGRRINPIYVEDAVRTFEPAFELPGSNLINVAGDEVVTITDLVGIVEQMSGARAVVSHSNAGELGDIVGSNERMKELLGVYPQTSLLDGLRHV